MAKKKKNVKKSFYKIEAPLTATPIQLYAAAPEDLDGKTIKLDMTRSLRGKSLILKMKIANDEDKLTAQPVSIELATSFIRRAMRRGTDYAEDSFPVECKDATVRVKPLMITRRRVSRAVLNALRTEAKKQLESYIKSRTAEEVFGEIMTNKIQKGIAARLKKIYPLALCEIRVFKVESYKEESK